MIIESARSCDSETDQQCFLREQLGNKKIEQTETDDETATMPLFPSSSSESSLVSLHDYSFSSDGNESITSTSSNSNAISSPKIDVSIQTNHSDDQRATDHDEDPGTGDAFEKTKINPMTNLETFQPSSMQIEADVIREASISRVRRRNRGYALSRFYSNRNRGVVNHMSTNTRRRKNGKSAWLISSDNRLKVLWDICTAILSICSFLYANHEIQTKSYEQSYFVMFCEIWFLVDICLNFVTEHKTINGDVTCDGKAVWARYLTTWFPIDVLSLIPWERIFVKPIVDMQKKRGFFKKNFFRTKAALRVTRKLRGGHFKLFGRIANKSKHAGVGGRKLLTYIIKYLPKYVLFYKNMKGVLALRMLRQVHWVLKVVKTWVSPKKVKSNPQDDSFDYKKKSRRFASPLKRIKEFRSFERKTYESFKTELEKKPSRSRSVSTQDVSGNEDAFVKKNRSNADTYNEVEDLGLGIY